MVQNYALKSASGRIKYQTDDQSEEDQDENLRGEYNIEDEEDNNINSEYIGEKKNDNSDRRNTLVNPIRLLFDMMLNPINGWKEIRRAEFTADEVSTRCFLPLIGISAGSCLLKCLYHASVNLTVAVIAGVKIFVALYLGYFLTLLLIKIVMPGKYKTISDSNFGKQFVMFLLSTLAIFYCLYQCLPMIGPALTFLPLWTIYLAMRGCRFFHFETEKYNLLTTLV
ncbi:MAG: hypothetical protein K2J15_04470, partial [Muribaculaceae bacterium]|nr:hypothetical protein [Muribaculaceae bacterium]